MGKCTSLFVLLQTLSFYTVITTCCTTTVPAALLVFGDSTVDTGNTNYIRTWLKANHTPYGVDFAGDTPTGRFSEGRLVPDLLAATLGLKEAVPPFLDPGISDEDIRTGVCFASAGSGFDDLTTMTSRAIPVSKQTKMLRQYLERLRRIVGEKEASNITGNALILISAGSNDVIFNFYDIPTRRAQYDIYGYQDFRLHLGGRKFIVAGLPSIGCIPIQRDINLLRRRSCKDDENKDATIYNSKLQNLLNQLKTSLPDSRIGYADIFNPAVDMINNPGKYGFEETGKGCCGTGYVEMGPSCCLSLRTTPCSDPSKFMFWDAVHPSQEVYKVITKKLLEDVVPALYNV